MQKDDIILFVDYGVFLLLLCVSTSVAVYSRLSGPKQKTKHDFVFASGSATSIPLIAMMMSIARGFLGVKSLLGYPSELFYRGSGMWETLYGMTIAFPLVCIFFVPVYYNLQTTSVYQYLDMRFNSRLIRCLASGTYVTRSLMKLGVTVFIPCVALKTTIGLPYWTSISSIVLVSLVFTIMGGLKTAIMADVTQLLVMIGCTLIIIFYGFVDNGGVLPVVKSNFQGGRLQFFNFNTDPTLRVTTISATVGQLFMSLSIFGCQQNFVQRYCSMKSQAQVRRTLMGNMPVIIVVFSLSWIAGMVIFTTYSDCDPMKLGLIQDIDEIVIYYVKDKFKFIPGFLGLIMACLYNGALNLCISNFNSISTVLWEDFVSQLPSMKGLPDSQQLVIIKIIAVVCAVIVGGFACLVALLSGVIESSLLVTSATSGPLLGVFLLAMFFPSANWKGAGVGMVVSHLVVLWIAINNRLVIKKPKEPFLPTTTTGCDDYFSFNTTIFPPVGSVHFSSSSSSTDGGWLESLYMVTFMYYSIMGTALTVIVGVIVSYIASSDEDELVFEEKLIHPLAIKISNWLPGRKRTYLQSQLHSPSSSTLTDKQEVENTETNPTKTFQK